MAAGRIVGERRMSRVEARIESGDDDALAA